MTNNETTDGHARDRSLCLLTDLVVKYKDNVITDQELDLFLKRQNPFPNPEELLAKWRRFYHEMLNLDLESDIVIPKSPWGFGWLVVIAKGLALDKVVEIDYVSLSPYQDRIQKIKDDRTPDKRTYALWARPRVKADKELKNCSAQWIWDRQIKTMTLLERLVIGAYYHRENPHHLDEASGIGEFSSETLCAGSRDSEGFVPVVGFTIGGSYVSLHNPGEGNRYLRARQVITA